MTSHGSYRESHSATGHGFKYDRILFSSGRFDADLWCIERVLLNDLVTGYFPRGIDSYLDFAVGTGRIIGEVAEHAKRTVGIDISSQMVSAAREKRPDLTYVLGDITVDSAALAGHGPFDCITAFRFFLNAEPELRESALRALVSVMTPGGYLICNNHGNSTSMLYPVLLLRRLFGMPLQNSLPRRELVALLEACGLEVVDSRAVCYLPRVTHRLLPRPLWTIVERFFRRVSKGGRFAYYYILVARRPLPN